MGAGLQGCSSQRREQPQGHTPGEKNPKKGALTKQKCSSLLSQGHLPGLTHVGIVETPGDEAPLCPEPPCTRGVTTIAPGGRGSSCSPAIPSGDRQGDGASLAWLKGSFGHIKPFFLSLFLSLQGFALRHQCFRHPNPEVPPCQVPDQLLLPGATGLGKPQAKGLCLKTKDLGL